MRLIIDTDPKDFYEAVRAAREMLDRHPTSKLLGYRIAGEDRFLSVIRNKDSITVREST